MKMKLCTLLLAMPLGVLAVVHVNAATPATATAPATQVAATTRAFEPETPLPADLKLTSLFDGKSLDGWIQLPVAPPDSWVVKDGVMASTGIARGVIYTKEDYGNFRLLLTMRHVAVAAGKKDHPACLLFFCTRPVEGQKPLDALAGIQFQIPNANHWDYRKGHNNSGKGEFATVPHPKFDEHQWSRIELLVNVELGTARIAVAQPPGTKAIEVGSFKDLTAAKKGPIALQIHNAGLLDEYKDVEIESDPAVQELLTTR